MEEEKRIDGCFCKECGQKKYTSKSELNTEIACDHEHERLKSYGDKYCRYCGVSLL